MILKFAMSRGLFAVIGAVIISIGGLGTVVWYQSNQLQKMRDAVAISSLLLAQETKKTQELRSVIDNQNQRIISISKESERKEAEAKKRVNQLLQERSKLIKESNSLAPGPTEMNKWLKEQF
jgi:signal transduction histidine kinase